MKILRRLTEKRGTTLGEMMVAVLILMLLTMVAAGGTGVAVKVYRLERAYSESSILANSLLLAMTEELRYAGGLTVDEDGLCLSYNSRVYGAGVTMEIEQQEADGSGMIKLSFDNEDEYAVGRTAYLYHESTYSGYRIRPQEDHPLFESDGSAIIITYDICDAYGNVQTSVDGVKIRLLNQTGTSDGM